MIKKIFLFFSLMSCAVSFAQNDSILIEILQYQDENLELINKGRDLLLSHFEDSDFKKVSEIKDYLLQETENKDYFALFQAEHWLILYWTEEHETMLDILENYNVEEAQKKLSGFQPKKDRLFLELKKKTIDSLGYLKEKIDANNLQDFEKDILKWHLNFLTSVYERSFILTEYYTDQVNKYTQAQSGTTPVDKKNFIAFSPSSTTQVNGIMLRYWDEDYSTKTINGLELGLNPIGIFIPFMTAIHSIVPFEFEPPEEEPEGLFKTINGVQLSLVNLEPSITNGLEINLSGSFHNITNGVSIAPAINRRYEMNGVGIALMGNMDNKCRGVQIGLVNKCDDLKGLQIGLWNKNQKRSFPIINWNFSK